MSPGIFLYTPFDSEDAWDNFELNHGITHQTVYRTLLSNNVVPDFSDIYSFPRTDNMEYLFTHWQIHQSNAKLLGIADLPDISEVDLSDEGQFSDWMEMHAYIHYQEYQALGLT